jgi:hypothetical protein
VYDAGLGARTQVTEGLGAWDGADAGIRFVVVFEGAAARFGPAGNFPLLTVDAAGRDEGSVTADEFKNEPLVIPPGPHFRRSGGGAVDTRKSHHGQFLPSGTVRPSPFRIQSGGKERHQKQTGHAGLYQPP